MLHAEFLNSDKEVKKSCKYTVQEWLFNLQRRWKMLHTIMKTKKYIKLLLCYQIEDRMGITQ